MFIRIINIVLLLVVLGYGQVKWRDLAPQTRQTISDLAADSAASVVQDSIAFPVDTTALKLLAMDAGRVAYMRGLDATNNPDNGGGLYVVMDSAHIEMGGIVYDHPTVGKQWIEDYFLKTGITNPVSMGAIGDSTATSAVTYANNRRINAAMDFAATTEKRLVILPPGKFVFHAKVDTGTNEHNYGIMLEPMVEFRGSGMTATILYTDSAAGIAIFGSPNFDTAPYDERVVHVSDFKLVGTEQYGGTSPGVNSGDAGLYIERPTASELRMKFVTVENLHIQGFGGNALQVANVNEVIANDIYIEDNNFTAINFSYCRNVILNDFIIDSTYFGLELAAGLRYDDRGEDSTTVFAMNNIIMTNVAKWGLRIYGGDFVEINNVHISGQKGIIPGAEDNGMWFTPQPVHSYEGFGDISINNSKIDGNGGGFFYGMSFRSSTPAGTDSSFGNITIRNTTVTGCRTAGIRVDPYDSTYIETLEISNSLIYNNNTDKANGLGGLGLVINNVDHPNIHNNKIFYNDTTLSSGKNPIYLTNCYKPSIHDNDFRDPGGTYEYSVYMDSTTAQKQPLIYNNQGLSIPSAYWNSTESIGYYQQSAVLYEGILHGGENSTTGVLYTMILDTACTVYYNTSGAAVDTIRQHPTR